jgi:hypothetical protein
MFGFKSWLYGAMVGQSAVGSWRLLVSEFRKSEWDKPAAGMWWFRTCVRIKQWPNPWRLHETSSWSFLSESFSVLVFSVSSVCGAAIGAFTWHLIRWVYRTDEIRTASLRSHCNNSAFSLQQLCFLWRYGSTVAASAFFFLKEQHQHQHVWKFIRLI